MDAPSSFNITGDAPTLLLIEEDQQARLDLAWRLRTGGYAVIEAETADHALRILKSVGNRVGCVFADIRLHGMTNPVGLASWLFANRPELSLILASASLRESRSGVLGRTDAPPPRGYFQYRRVTGLIERVLARPWAA